MGAAKSARAAHKKAAKRKIGRPRLPIDEKVVRGMASVGATNVEIAEFVGCDGDTIGHRFSDVLAKARANLKKRLRQKQFDVAMKGNVAMLIWLGKQMLGQSDKQLTELTGKNGGPVEIDTAGVRARIIEKLAGLASRVTPPPAEPPARHE